MEDLENILEPKRNKLLIDGDCVKAKILDGELDVLDCYFDYSNTVHINTQGYSHVLLTLENLQTLIKLIEESEEYFTNLDDY